MSAWKSCVQSGFHYVSDEFNIVVSSAYLSTDKKLCEDVRAVQKPGSPLK